MNNRRHHLTVAVSCFCLVGGCVQGPNYVKPTVEVPPSYRFNELSVETAQPAWWTAYHDHYLDDLVREALASNRDLRIADGARR